MCLAVPGKVIVVEEDSLGMRQAIVSFGGVRKKVCLAYVPEARVDDYVLVHVGFALSRIDEKEAVAVFRLLDEMDGLAELDESRAAKRTDEATPGESQVDG